MKKSVRVTITVFVVAIGICLAAYPFVSNYLYELRQDEVITDYVTDVENQGDRAVEEEKQKVVEYNKSLLNANVVLTDPFDPDAIRNAQAEPYNSLLNLNGDGVMGFLYIPAIDVRLSIYHGTSAEVLESGVGHLEYTSMPMGGDGTHTVMSAHTGLPGKKLFTDLELLEEGDIFYIYVLDEVLAYQVDRIKVTEPDDVSELSIYHDKDYVTLVTCTPYGVNSHRLLVRGERIPYEEAEAVSQETEKKTGSQWMRQYFYGVIVGLIIFLILLMIFFKLRSWRKKYEG